MPLSQKNAFISLEFLVKLVISVAFILLITYVALKFAFLLSSGQEEDAATNALNHLVEEIQKLEDKPYTYNKAPMGFFIPEGFIIVGLNYDYPIESQCHNEKIDLSRPENCRTKSCLCLYKETTIGKDFDGDEKNKAFLCHQFDEKIRFLAPFDNEADAFSGKVFPGIHPPLPNNEYDGVQYEYLVFYGSGCEDSAPGPSLLFIEKTTRGDKTFLYFDTDAKSAKLRRERLAIPPDAVCCLISSKDTFEVDYQLKKKEECKEDLYTRIQESCDPVLCNNEGQCIPRKIDYEEPGSIAGGSDDVVQEERIPEPTQPTSATSSASPIRNPEEEVCCGRATESGVKYELTKRKQCEADSGEITRSVVVAKRFCG